MTYRIKTQQEFENEYGPYWRHPSHFPQEMDVMLGQRVIIPPSCLSDDDKIVASFAAKQECFPYCAPPLAHTLSGIFMWYTITRDMVVEEHRAEKVSKIVNKIPKECQTA